MSFEQTIIWAKSRVGSGYVYGATGWVCTPERRAQQAVQYPEHAKNILSTAAKWDGKICYDCAQLVKAGLRQADITLPSGATSQWRSDKWSEKHAVREKPVPDDFCVLFRGDGDVMQHVGFHVGGGETVDARSTAQGVITDKLGRYGWTHWAKPGQTNDKGGVRVTKIVSTESGSLNLRAEPGGKIIDQIPKGTALQEMETNGEWSRVEVTTTMGERVGWVASRYLSDVVKSDGDILTVPKEALWNVYNTLGEMLGVMG